MHYPKNIPDISKRLTLSARANEGELTFGCWCMSVGGVLRER